MLAASCSAVGGPGAHDCIIGFSSSKTEPDGNAGTRRLHKATNDINRIVLLARSGFVTVDAIRWLTDAGIGLIHLDPNGKLLVSTASPSGHDPKLRRAQALAATSPTGVDITRRIIADKLTGQLEVATQLEDSPTIEAIAGKLEELPEAETLDQIRLLEAQAAAAYWSAWTVLPRRERAPPEPTGRLMETRRQAGM